LAPSQEEVDKKERQDAINYAKKVTEEATEY
jgi:hypothetical protein